MSEATRDERLTELQDEIAAIKAQLARGDADKDRFKDMLIAVLREATPEAAWDLFLEEAKRRAS